MRFGEAYLQLAEFWEAEAKRLTVEEDTSVIAYERRAIAQTLRSCADELKSKVAQAKDIIDSGAFV